LTDHEIDFELLHKTPEQDGHATDDDRANLEHPQTLFSCRLRF